VTSTPTNGSRRQGACARFGSRNSGFDDCVNSGGGVHRKRISTPSGIPRVCARAHVSAARRRIPTLRARLIASALAVRPSLSFRRCPATSEPLYRAQLPTGCRWLGHGCFSGRLRVDDRCRNAETRPGPRGLEVSRRVAPPACQCEPSARAATAWFHRRRSQEHPDAATIESGHAGSSPWWGRAAEARTSSVEPTAVTAAGLAKTYRT
jgi:hypothetical protein